MDYKSVGNVPLNLAKGELLEVKKVRRKNLPPFLMCGNGEPRKEEKDMSNAVDMAEELMKFTDTEKFAFGILYRKVKQRYYDEINCCYYGTCITEFIASKSLKTNTEKVKFSKGIKLLTEKNLVAKLGRSTFIINPNMIITSRFDSDIQEWNNIQAQKKEK